MWNDYEETDWDNWEYNPDDDGTNVQEIEETIIVKDANWNILKWWETVVAIKDLPVKWSKDIKRGDKFPKIRLTDDPKLIESWKMVLKTDFFKKI